MEETIKQEELFLSTDEEGEGEGLLEDDDGSRDPGPVVTTPIDQFNSVYITFIIVSVGMLFPWNIFILAIDYFRFLYPDKHVENVIPYTDLTVTLLMVTITLGVVKLIHVHLRILSGYCAFIVALLLIPFLDIGIYKCSVSSDVGFALTVLSVGCVAFGGGIQQGSFYGLAGMLPPRFTQALMLGESIAGFAVSVLRIVTKVTANSEREGAIAFFAIGLVYIILCVVGQAFIYRSKFVKYYINQSKISSRQVEQLDIVSERSIIPPASIQEIAPKYCLVDQSRVTGPIQACVRVVKQIWKVALSVFITLFVTLLVFPGLSSDIQDCSISDWPPVINAAVFNVSDMISRIIVVFFYRLNPNILLLCSSLRIILVPLFVLCVSPSPTSPVLDDPLWIGIVLVAVLGLTNGSLATIAMVQGPMGVASQEDREIAGNLMVFFLLLGLSIGSVLAAGLTPLTEIGTVISCTNATAPIHCTSSNTSLSL